MMSSLRWLCACGLISAFVACGDDSSDDVETAAGASGMSGAGPSRGGAAGEPAGGGGGDEAASTGGDGDGSGGTGGDVAEGGAGGAPPPDCATIAPDDFFGSLDGMPISEQWPVESTGRVAQDPWFIIDHLQNRGFEHFSGPGQADPFTIGSEEQEVTFGLLLAPSESTLAGDVICFEEGTVIQRPSALELRTETAKLLGACPGEPVEGELVLCSENGFECDQPVRGELDGSALDGSGLQISGTGEAPDMSMHGRGEHFAVVSYVEGDAPSMQAGAVDYALLFVFPSGGEPGAVYCAGADSTYEWQTVNGTLLSLQNLSKLGDCGGGTDDLLVCR